MGGVGKTGTRVAIGVLTFFVVGIAGGLLWTTLVVGDSGSGCAVSQAQERGPQGPPPGVDTPTEQELIGWRTAVAEMDAELATAQAVFTPPPNGGGAAGSGGGTPPWPPDVSGLTPAEGWIDVQPPESYGIVGGEASLPEMADPC